MTRFVLDPATLVHLVRRGLEPHAAHQLVAPNALRSQALELLLREVAAGELVEREALALHERMTGIKVRLLGDRVSRRTAWTLAREFGWADLTDAEYLGVTRLQADALIATGARLRERAAGVVPLAAIDDLLEER
jgi:hypothetical protein